MHSFLITGKPGVGKSTLVQCVLDSLSEQVNPTGIISGEIRINGKRSGFTVKTLGGQEGLLASPEIKGEPRFGTYGPDGKRRLGISLAYLETQVCPSVEKELTSADLVVIDELGLMQAESPIFRELVEKIINSGIPVLATSGIYRQPWLDAIRASSAFAHLEITENNRNALTEMITLYLNSTSRRLS